MVRDVLEGILLVPTVATNTLTNVVVWVTKERIPLSEDALEVISVVTGTLVTSLFGATLLVTGAFDLSGVVPTVVVIRDHETGEA